MLIAICVSNNFFYPSLIDVQMTAKDDSTGFFCERKGSTVFVYPCFFFTKTGSNIHMSYNWDCTGCSA